jgi:F-type H+-transporting ATPase subunit epsilon
MIPEEILFEGEVDKVSVETREGALTILPRHIDFVTALSPGVMSYQVTGGGEQYVATDEGVLVKQGDQVRISTIRAVRGRDLQSLRQTISERFETLDEEEQEAREVLERLENDFIRRYVDWGKERERL